MDFDPFLAQIRPHFGSFLGSFLAPFLAPLRGAILSENTRKTNVLHCFGAPKRLTFGPLFWLHFCSISGSILDPFSDALWARPKPPILHSLEAGQA